MEIWKDIPGYEGRYQASNLGNIKSILFSKEKVLIGRDSKQGYMRVVLYKDKIPKHFAVHRLVAITFIENLYNKSCINHINGIKTDNKVENLEWITPKENTAHAFANGLMDGMANAKSVLQFSINGTLLNKYISASEASRIAGIHSSGITACCRGEYISSGGFIWRYS